MNKIINEPDYVLMVGEWATGVIFDVGVDHYGMEEEYNLHFEAAGSKFMGDPDESFYDGVVFTTVIRRKADGKLFGYDYWRPVAPHGDYDIEPNGFDFVDVHHPGLRAADDYDTEFYVWFPVETFTITGYKVNKPEGFNG